jgi:hypothetical protein
LKNLKQQGWVIGTTGDGALFKAARSSEQRFGLPIRSWSEGPRFRNPADLNRIEFRNANLMECTKFPNVSSSRIFLVNDSELIRETSLIWGK